MTTLLIVYASIAVAMLLVGFLLSGCSGARDQSDGKLLMVAALFWPVLVAVAVFVCVVVLAVASSGRLSLWLARRI